MKKITLNNEAPEDNKPTNLDSCVAEADNTVVSADCERGDSSIPLQVGTAAYVPNDTDASSPINHFTPAQLRAIHHTEGPMLVLAGPGSGKTSVITARILYLIREKHVAPESILVITFTREAAGEMQKRFLDNISSMEQGSFFENADTISSDPRRVCFGTMHAVFLKILRAEYGTGRFHLFGNGEKFALIGEILAEMGINGAGQYSLQKEVSEEIELLKTAGIDPELYESRALEPEQFRKVFESYGKRKRATGAMDYDDLLFEAERLFLKRRDILEKWKKNFSYILVDEAQDNNAVQYRLLMLLAGECGNLFLVGDDDQSLYAFRGSKPEQLQDFCRKMNISPILLEENFRSLSAVTEPAGRMIEYNRSRQPKRMIPVREGEGVFRIETYPNYSDQTDGIVRILRSLAAEGIPFDECAILVRTGSEASLLVAGLSLAGIPYDLREKISDPLEEYGVRGVISFMKVANGVGTLEDWTEAACAVRLGTRRALWAILKELCEAKEKKLRNPDRNGAGRTVSSDHIFQNSVKEAFNSTQFGHAFEESTRRNSIQINHTNEARTYEDSASVDHSFNTFSADSDLNIITIDEFFQKMRSSGLAGENLDRFHMQLTLVSHLRPYAAINLIRKGIGYETKYLLPWEKVRGRKTEDISAKLDFVQEMAKKSESFEEWMENLEKFQKSLSEVKKNQTHVGVRLMTYHASKGLEFDVVILPDLCEGFVPHRKAITPEEVEEERRMLFVAMTRAKDRLYLLTPGERLGKKLLPSRFLREIENNKPRTKEERLDSMKIKG